jgi:LAO/AO transport system kinase
MEMADVIVINKADGDNIRKAELAKSEFKRASFPAKKIGWIPTPLPAALSIKMASSEVWETIEKF